jgi:hypothetical protein
MTTQKRPRVGVISAICVRLVLKDKTGPRSSLRSSPSSSHVVLKGHYQRLAGPCKGYAIPSTEKITVYHVSTATGEICPLASSPTGCMPVPSLAYPNRRGNHRRDRIRVVHPLELIQHHGSGRHMRADSRKAPILASPREARGRRPQPCHRRRPSAPTSVRGGCQDEAEHGRGPPAGARVRL